METLAQENAVLSQNQPILPEQPKQNNFLIILLSILLLLSVSIVGFFAYQTQKLTTELKIKDKVLIVRTPDPTVEPTTRQVSTNFPVFTSTPTASTSLQIPGWKFFVNNSFSFQYPGEWEIGQENNSIVSDRSGAGIAIFKDNSMMNECMKVDRTDTVSGKMVKYYSYIYSGEMCSDASQIGNYQAWITKAGGTGYGPGIIYSYNTTAYPKSFEIFKSILSTFKFTN